MKYALLLISALFLLNAHADEPTKSEMEAYRAVVAEKSETVIMFGLRKVPCFYEHICSSGPIGRYQDCEQAVEWCLRDAHTQRDEYSEEKYNRMCRPLFAEFTPAQNAMISAPKFCEAPPPPIAFRPTFTSTELQCYCENYSEMMITDYETCVRNESKCTQDMRLLNGTDRVRCRATRHLAVSSREPWLTDTAVGACKIAMPYPALWDDRQPQAIPSTQPSQAEAGPLPPPRTWQEQVERNQPPSSDEFDLGDLNF